MDKTATTDHEVLGLIKKRWSPRAFSDKPVEAGTLQQLFEAARWAPSAYNEQPWRFIVATPEQPAEFERMLECLRRKNRSWASAAPVLILSLAKQTVSHTGDVNRHAWHDLGLATASLIFQAVALGLHVHPMAGIYPDVVRETYAVPDDYEPVAALALGYLGDPETLPEDLRARELKKRRRRPISELVFSGHFGHTAHVVRQEEAVGSK